MNSTRYKYITKYARSVTTLACPIPLVQISCKLLRHRKNTLRIKVFYFIYAVQQDTQSVSMSEFYSALMLAHHVSDLIGPSSGAFFTSCIRRFGMCCTTQHVQPCE